MTKKYEFESIVLHKDSGRRDHVNLVLKTMHENGWELMEIVQGYRVNNSFNYPLAIFRKEIKDPLPSFKGDIKEDVNFEARIKDL